MKAFLQPSLCLLHLSLFKSPFSKNQFQTFFLIKCCNNSLLGSIPNHWNWMHLFLSFFENKSPKKKRKGALFIKKKFPPFLIPLQMCALQQICPANVVKLTALSWNWGEKLQLKEAIVCLKKHWFQPLNLFQLEP